MFYILHIFVFLFLIIPVMMRMSREVHMGQAYCERHW
jgi:hypothetical protein